MADVIKRVMDSHAPVAGGTQRWLRLWRSTAPPEMADAVRSASFSRGVLTLRTPNAAWSHRLQAWLRAGGNRSLQIGAPIAIRTVRVMCVRR